MPGEGTTDGALGLEETEAAARRDAEALAGPATALVAEGALDRGQARAVLPHVLSDVPVAVLLVDQHSDEVVFANRSAVEMAGDVHLPVGLADWARASSLTDRAGRSLGEAPSVLERVLGASPTAGEAVRTAAGATERLLWATGIPLGVEGRERPMALVVFLEMASPPGGHRGHEQEMAALRDRAIIATDLAFTISDPRRDDNPLIWVNPAFSRVTGYSGDEAVGRNCRYLQGPGTDPDTLEVLRQAIAAAEPIAVTLLNYRKDGTAFWNQLAISPVFDGDDRLVSFVGVQSDVSERVRVDAEREAALQAERAARREMERTRGHLALLAEATTQLSATLDTAESLERLADLVVPSLADWVVINLAEDGQGSTDRLLVRHRQAPDRLIDRYVELQPESLRHPSSFIPRLLAGGESVLVSEYHEDDIGMINPPEMREVVQELGIVSAMYVPLVARQRKILGTVVLVAGPSGRHFTQEDLSVAADLARRAGMSMDNARLYEQEHRVAEILQRSLLPTIPKVPGIAVSAQYLPANTVADVGGDFYEILGLPDRSVGVAVGDVVGHDLSAAAAMGHLRGLLRACAWDDASHEAYADPERVLDRVDRLVQGLDVVPLATLLYARLVPAAGGWRLTYANAGHPAPLLRLPDGTVALLDDARGLLLGVASGAERRTRARDVPVGSILVGYTDGLVERRGGDMADSVERLVRLVGRSDPGDLDGMVGGIVATLGRDRDDDVAVIAVRVDG
ncbi:SpoIIE family protein phosphatase [Acidiferrimicrobium sp. IK]|uniref:SpoIIE family protein phosphatase n=1 Tax=Acidiferrimicrobium sp. IK TaxID=2871700 RepID=UPI0021CAE478|nr:SpoIIE family protein phosphatase [Acidiferrimicrobium sp. IK]MCU4186843.1 SpoIIE family protein phosphatase [Acidiferrimicrobium sp. IK]